MALRYALNGVLGANIDDRTTEAKSGLGEVVMGNDDNLYIYVQANGAVATGTCTVNTSTFQLTDAAGNFTADVAFADNEFGWVRQTAKLAP